MITDEMIIKAAEEANQVILDSLPCSKDCKHNFSAKFENKMKRQFTKANHPKMYRFLKSIAGIIVALFIGGGTLLTTNGEVRAAVWGWIKEQCGTLFSYQFNGETLNPNGLKKYELDVIPDGYSEVDKQHSELDGYSIYMNETGDILQFVYSGDYENIAIYVNNVEYDKTNVFVNEYEADLYMSNNPNNSPALVWINEKENIAFLLSGFLDTDTLINLAENIISQD